MTAEDYDDATREQYFDALETAYRTLVEATTVGTGDEDVQPALYHAKNARDELDTAISLIEDTQGDSDEGEWDMDAIEDTLTEMNEAITGENLDEMTLWGEVGFHIFADPDAESPVAGMNKQLHIAFTEAIDQLFVDEDIVEDYYGEVTPLTVCATVEDQMDDFFGHGGLDEAFLHALGREMGVEPDVMSAGKMFSDGPDAEVF